MADKNEKIEQGLLRQQSLPRNDKRQQPGQAERLRTDIVHINYLEKVFEGEGQ